MAKNTLTPDIEYSLSALNYLLCSYQGRYAFLKVLTDFGVGGVDERELPRCEDALKRINQWFLELIDGSPLFSEGWTSPGTFEAKRALDLLEAIKPELQWLSDVCSKAAKPGVLNELPLEELRILSACNARIKVMAHFYCLGNIRFGEAMKLAEFTKYNRSIEPKLGEDVGAAYLITQAFVDPDTTRGPSFNAGLATEISSLSPIARTHIHDINVITARFRGGLSFLTVDFTEAEASKWMAAGVTAIDAGYWRAHSFDSGEATTWRRSGIQLPSVAAVWGSFGFAPTDAGEWVKLGFEAWDAAQWRSARFSPQEARSFKDRGISDPAKIPGR